MKNLPDKDQLAVMRRVARLSVFEAGRIIRTHHEVAKPMAVENKSRFDFVTSVDRRCEELILDRISRRFPGHGFLAEESPPQEGSEPVTWVVDPLDGTTNFVHGFPFVAVSVAAIVGETVTLGFVLDPLRGELFEAQKGCGAFLNGRPIAVSREADPERMLLATGFPFREREFLEVYLKVFGRIFKRVGGVRRAGAAALDLAYLAAGRVDGFWETGLKPWDIAAGALLIEEAGGRVSDFHGAERHIQTGHIVAGSPACYPFLLEEVKSGLAPYITTDASR